MKKVVLSLAAVFGLLTATTAVEARPDRSEQSSVSRKSSEYRGKKVTKVRKARTAHRSRHARRSASSRRSYRTAYSSAGRSSLGFVPSASGVGPRPRKWCGWWMRTQLGGGPAYNLAWNWRNYGSPTSPRVGAVVIWRHHVGIITGQASNGRWIVKSGNDGGQVRERARSVSGAIFRI
jgi:hypothetical protein